MKRSSTWWFKLFVRILIVAILVSIPVIIVAAIVEDARWEEYAETNGCVQTAETRTSYSLHCLTVNKITQCHQQPSTEHLWVCERGDQLRVWR